ncbi:MAG: transporter [Bacteroidales bacterium]|nr:transporter [Bacteroidales bacterium]
MSKLKSFIKNWALPLSMCVGIISYLVYHFTPALYPAGPFLHEAAVRMQPVLIFFMLFFQFAKVSPKDIKPRLWHLWLLLFQGIVYVALVVLVLRMTEGMPKVLVESLMACIICPAAAASGVITSKIGGDLAADITYVVLINCLVALLLPAFNPMIHPMEGLSFMQCMWVILRKVFPTLLFPAVAAWTIRALSPKLHAWISERVGWAFNIWVITLSIALCLTTKTIVNTRLGIGWLAAIGAVSLVACLMQFRLGRLIGKGYGYTQSVTSGQVLGQKNNTFILWFAYAYMSPMIAIAAGFYCVWQNLVNSWELREYRLSGGTHSTGR